MSLSPPTTGSPAPVACNPTSPRRHRVGLIDPRSQPGPLVRRLFAADWCACERLVLDNLHDFGVLNRFDAIVLCDIADKPAGQNDAGLDSAHRQLELLRKRQIGVVVLTHRPWRFAGFDAGVVCLAPDSSFDKLHGSLLALAHLRPLILQLDLQYSAMQRLGKNLARRFEATNRELQLASQLQRDFLPRGTLSAGPYRFASMFRPCSWVSGDIFDIFRLDESHWGFYLADAVGHGVAAGLLTMYIKHAIRPKRIHRDEYEILKPSEVLCHLNDLLAQQGLPDSQFITGWYGVLNTESNTLQYAVAGHPPALLIGTGGGIRELHGDGCLLGIGAGERFSDESVTLSPGDRVFIYSDGLEPVLITKRPPLPGLPTFESGIPELLRMPAPALFDRLGTTLDAMPGSLSQADDVSIVTLDYETPSF